MTARSVRPATPADHALFARFFRELGVPEEPPEAGLWVAQHMPTSFFVVEGDTAVGYARYDTLGREGYIRHVVTHPDHRGRGVGRDLMRALGARLRAAGCDRQRLNVKVDNRPALALYAAFGMTVEFVTTVLRLSVPPACAPNGATRAHDAPEAEDAALEREFGLLPGRLALGRRAPGARVLVAARGPERAPVGVAVFDPRMPGCFPFRARDEEAADALLDRAVRGGSAPNRAAAAQLDPGPPLALQVAVEDHPALAAALLARGGELVFDLAHLAGPLEPEPRGPGL